MGERQEMKARGEARDESARVMCDGKVAKLAAMIRTGRSRLGWVGLVWVGLGWRLVCFGWLGQVWGLGCGLVGLDWVRLG